MVNVLFVCLGNICRSPMAEAVFRRMIEAAGLADAVFVASAGTAAWQAGRPPDPRAVAAARSRGIDLPARRARQVTPADFEDFDCVVAMDEDNLADLHALCPPRRADHLHLLLTFAAGSAVRSVPDPYFGAPEGFDRALDLIEAGADGLFAHVRRCHFAGTRGRAP